MQEAAALPVPPSPAAWDDGINGHLNIILKRATSKA
jgi:hypothetical protein